MIRLMDKYKAIVVPLRRIVEYFFILFNFALFYSFACRKSIRMEVTTLIIIIFRAILFIYCNQLVLNVVDD